MDNETGEYPLRSDIDFEGKPLFEQYGDAVTEGIGKALNDVGKMLADAVEKATDHNTLCGVSKDFLDVHENTALSDDQKRTEMGKIIGGKLTVQDFGEVTSKENVEETKRFVSNDCTSISP